MSLTEAPLRQNTFSRKRILIEVAAISALSFAVFITAGRYDILESIVEFSHRYESYELDEVITVSMFLVIGMAYFAIRRVFELRHMNAVLSKRNTQLEAAAKEIRQLHGILPICASCKKIRDDQGNWHQIEPYIEKHSEAEFTHGICPDCTERLYPDFVRHRAAKKGST